ncbi:MAG: DUF4144 domain-containing protein [Gammaproteobacteria bacterium]|nr:DUF4144 domain-containing protein [Gammaproteobacteria bacterium]
MIQWPAIINYLGEDELIYIANEDGWSNDPDLNSYPYTKGDELIDSHGDVYSLFYNQKKEIVEMFKEQQPISLLGFEQIVKKHLAILNQCCISKISLCSFQEGLLLIEKAIE